MYFLTCSMSICSVFVKNRTRSLFFSICSRQHSVVVWSTMADTVSALVAAMPAAARTQNRAGECADSAFCIFFDDSPHSFTSSYSLSPNATAFLHYLAFMSGQSVHVQTSAGARVKGIFHTSLAFSGKDFLLCLKAAAEVREFGHGQNTTTPSRHSLFSPPFSLST